MMGIAVMLDDLWTVVGEVDVLVTLTVVAYDEADPVVIESMASLLGLIKKSAAAATVAFHRLHGAVADAAPAPAGERWTTTRARHRG